MLYFEAQQPVLQRIERMLFLAVCFTRQDLVEFGGRLRNLRSGRVVEMISLLELSMQILEQFLESFLNHFESRAVLFAAQRFADFLGSLLYLFAA